MKIPKYKKIIEQIESMDRIRQSNRIMHRCVIDPCMRGIYAGEVASDIEDERAFVRTTLARYLDYIPQHDSIGSAIRTATSHVAVIGHNYRDSNPYYRNIHFSRDEVQSGVYTLIEQSLPAYTIIERDSPDINLYDMEYPRLGLITEEFYYPCIISDGEIVSRITPYEISTMKNAVSYAYGDVLILGSHLGYPAYMMLECNSPYSDGVDQVTIVEPSQDIATLFKEHILPQFPHPEKITVVVSDVFEYMENLEDGQFDCCLAAPWSGGDDMLMYRRFCGIARQFHRTKIFYWLESELKHGMRAISTLAVSDEFYGEDRRALLPECYHDIYEYYRNRIRDIDVTPNPNRPAGSRSEMVLSKINTITHN